MKILYIDHISPKGHVAFNQIHIKALLSLGYEVHCVFRKEYYKKIIDDSNHKDNNIRLVMELPDLLYTKQTNVFISRIYYLIQLLSIRRKVLFSSYNAIILSAYEPISLFFANIKFQTFVINHNNISDLCRSKIKEYFTRKLSKRNIHIVFDKNAQQRLEKSKIFNSEIVPHGCNNPFVKNIDDTCLTSLFSIDKRIKQTKYSIVFCPSSTSVDKDFLSKIIADEIFNNFLIENNILFLIKGNCCCSVTSNKNFIMLNRYLTDIEYQYLFKLSKAIILPYGTNFRYRTSGILFECFANNKPCLILQNESMYAYSKYFKYKSYFETISELCSQILFFKNFSKHDRIYLNMGELNPAVYWEKLLDEFK